MRNGVGADKCSVEWCDSVQYRHGYCSRHYQQIKKFGEIRFGKRSIRDKNEVLIRDDYAEIVIYDRSGIETARSKIDLSDIVIVSKMKWCLGDGYVGTKINKKFVKLHKYLLNYDGCVDHINRDRLDNRRSNLRRATIQQNTFNIGPRSRNTTGFKGVCNLKGKYVAQIKINGKNIQLGKFSCPEDAAEAYNKAAAAYYGEFAFINTITVSEK